MLRGAPCVHLRLRCGDFIEEIDEHDVAHAEAERGQVHLAVAHQREQPIVASAASEGALVLRAVEHLEDDARVVREPAHNRVVHFDKRAEPARLHVGDDRCEFRGGFLAAHECEQRPGSHPEFLQRGGGLLRRSAFGLVHDLEKLVLVLRRQRSAIRAVGIAPKKCLPRRAAREAHDEIFLREPECAEHIHQHREQFRIRRGRGLADDVAIEL